MRRVKKKVTKRPEDKVDFEKTREKIKSTIMYKMGTDKIPIIDKNTLPFLKFDFGFIITVIEYLSFHDGVNLHNTMNAMLALQRFDESMYVKYMQSLYTKRKFGVFKMSYEYVNTHITALSGMYNELARPDGLLHVNDLPNGFQGFDVIG